MIRINLLPGEERQQRRAASSFKAGDLVVPIAVFAAAFLIVAGTAMSQRTRVGSLTQQISDVDAQSRMLAPQIERVNRLAQERAELDLRLGIINRLEQGRTQSVRLMDELARCIPDHLWISNAIQESPTQLSVEGSTLSNLVVSDLMSRLEHSPMFAGVELAVAEREQRNGKDIVKFRVTCQVTADQPAN